LHQGTFSAAELTEAFLKRIDNHRVLNAFIEVLADSARKEAQLCDTRLKRRERAPLLGVPLAIKDMILTAGTRTTCASRMLKDFVAPYDATVTQELKSAGAVCLGKTNMDEFAMGSSNENSAFGAVRNPWNLERVSGGSSGGSAAAVAQRLCAGALGTDTGGSVRQPAAFCGVVGIKPTYGRVSRYGVVAFASSLDQVGVLASNVRDAAILTGVISGYDPLDSTSVNQVVPNFEAHLGQEIKSLKIGIPDEYFIPGMSAEVEKIIKQALKKLEDLGAELVRVGLPHTNVAVPTYYILAPAEASSNLARYDGVRYGRRAADIKDLDELYFRSRSEGFGAEVKRRIIIGTYVLSRGYYDQFYLKAQKVRSLIARDFKCAFERHCDLIACPTAPSSAFRLGEKISDPLAMYLSDVFTIPANLAGLPALSIPCGFDSSDLPVGLQLIGKPWDESTLFKAAYAYESATEWHKRLPPEAGAGPTF